MRRPFIDNKGRTFVYDGEQWNCGDHPKYQAVRKPRCLCEACWWLWFRKLGWRGPR